MTINKGIIFYYLKKRKKNYYHYYYCYYYYYYYYYCYYYYSNSTGQAHGGTTYKFSILFLGILYCNSKKRLLYQTIHVEDEKLGDHYGLYYYRIALVILH